MPDNIKDNEQKPKTNTKPSQPSKPKAETLKAVASSGYDKKAAFERRLLDRLRTNTTQQEIAQSGITLSPSDLIKAGATIKQATNYTGIPTANQQRQQTSVSGTLINAKVKSEYDVRYDEAMNNTINAMWNEDLKKNPTLFKVETPSYQNRFQGNANYQYYKDKILKEGKKYNGIAITNGPDGKPYIGTKRGLYDTLVKGWNDYHLNLAESSYYLNSDKDSVKRSLENGFNNKPTTTGPLPIYNSIDILSNIASTIGGMGQTVMDVTAMSLGTSGMLPAGGTMFAAAAPDATIMKYGTSLKEYYNLAREQNLSPDEAYEKANAAAKQAAGWEVANQGAFALTGGLKLNAPQTGVSLFSSAQKQSFAKSAIHHLKSAGFIGSSAGLTQAGADLGAEASGIKIPDKFERSLESARDMFIMDIGFKTIGGLINAPKSFKAQNKSLLASVDKSLRKQFAASKEASGEYPAGTGRQVEKEVSSWNSAASKTPEIADEQRKAVVIGLTEKLTKLEEKQSKLAEIHKATMQPEIDDVKSRIILAQTAEDPLVAELNDDGTPLIKTEQNATTETQKPIQEVSTTSGVSEYTGTESVQAPKTIQADTGNRPVSGAEEKVSIADKIRKFKIDESILTGGDKGAMQSNIAGLPIGIYNASVEAIALSVEAGESLVSAIDKQIQQLKQSGKQFNEEKFRKTVSLIDKESNNRAKLMSEAEMQGIKSSDYTALQRFALEKYNQNDIYKNPQEMAKSLRAELSKKMDTSNISDDVFEMIGYDAVLNEGESPFTAGPAKKITMPFEQETDPMRISARDAFKGMYQAANEVGKGIKNRVSMAAKAVKEALKGQGLDLDENALTRSIGKFVTSRMDTETAMETFMDNLDEIVGDARDVVSKKQAKSTIRSIIKNSKNDAFSTVAIKETVGSIDWISPSKIDPTKLEEYNRLLEDFNRSITGQVSESETARQDLEDFVNEQRAWSETKKQERLETKYDKLVQQGKIDASQVSKAEYVDWNMNPDAKVTPEAQNVLKAVDESEAVVMRDLTSTRQEMLKEYMASGEMNEAHSAEAEVIANIPVDKVSSKNIKLLNNIIEDIMSGEQPSRIDEITTDVGAKNKQIDLENSIKNVKSASTAKTMGAFKKAWAGLNILFGKTYTGAKTEFKKFGITNIMRQLVFNDPDAATLRFNTVADFERQMNRMVTSKSIAVRNEMERIYTGGKYKAKRLTSLNDVRIGIVAALTQFDDIYQNLETLKNSLLTLDKISESNIGEYNDVVKKVSDALVDLGIADVKFDGKRLLDIQFKEGLDVNNLESFLNDRESAALNFARTSFKDLFPDLSNTVRNVFGERLDMTSKNYTPLSTFFTGEANEVEFDNPGWGRPNYIKTMRSGTTMERQPFMVSNTTRSGKNVQVHYDFNFRDNFNSKYHETLSTAHTAKEIKELSKLLNTPEFHNFISGKLGVKPELYNENFSFFVDKVKDYVDSKRSPYALTAAQIQERKAFSKFVYSKMLHGWTQVFKQSVPAYAYFMTEGSPLHFMNSQKILLSYLVDPDTRSAVKDFLSYTSKTDRVAAGMEVFAKELSNLDDGMLIRGGKKINDIANKFTSFSFELGDNITTMNALLIGYTKGLAIDGQLKSFESFDLKSHMKQGINKKALAYAENYLALVNSESSAAAKAMILKEKDAFVTRMLAGFNLNQYVNLNIDMGRMFGGTTSEKIQAAKRVGQFLGMSYIYGQTIMHLRKDKSNLSSLVLGAGNVPLAEEDEEEKKKREDTEKMMQAVSQAIDIGLAGQSMVEQQGVKMGIDIGTYFARKYYENERIKQGKGVDNTIYDTKIPFIYRNSMVGPSGSWLTSIEKMTKDMFTGKDIDYSLEKQKSVSNDLNMWYAGGTLALPSNMELTRAAMKEIDKRKIDKRDKWSELYSLYNDEDTNPKDREMYKSALYDEIRQLLKSKNVKTNPNDQEITAWLNNNLVDYANKKRIKEIYLTAKKYDFADHKFSETVQLAQKLDGKKLFMMMNNRFAGKDLEDKEVLFLIQNGCVTPEEYAYAGAMDKDGEVRLDLSEEELSDIVNGRLVDARAWHPKPGKVGIRKTSEYFSAGSIKSSGDIGNTLRALITARMNKALFGNK